MSPKSGARPIALLLALLALAPLAAMDPNERREALRHLATVRKEAGMLARLAAVSSVQPTSVTSDPRRVSAALQLAADALAAAVESEDRSADLERLYERLDAAADDLEPALGYFPPKGGARSRLSNVRWSVGRTARLIGLEDEEEEKYTVGPISPEQGEVLLARVGALLDRAVELSRQLAGADPEEVMYRDLLRSQMTAFIDPAAALKVAVHSRPGWWSPEAYQAVTRITRLVALTRNETRKLPPAMLELLERVWTASEELEAAANEIEHGARASGPDAKIEFLPVPASR